MDPANDSQFVRRHLAGKVSVREWLKINLKKRGIGEMTGEESMELVARIYTMGAEMVWASKLKEGDGGYESAEILLVALPEDLRQRQEIFKWFVKHTVESGFDPERDCGQAHIAVWFP